MITAGVDLSDDAPVTSRPMVVLTVSGNRPGYLAETLATWARVRGLDAWTFGFLVEPGPQTDRCREVIAEFAARGATATTVEVVNERRLGVLANPHRALSWAFGPCAAPFAVLAEEDIVVSDDVLEFFTAQAEASEGDASVLGLCAFSRLARPQPAAAVGSGEFSPWVWGTWAGRWRAHLADRWFAAARGAAPHVEEGFDYGIVRILNETGMRMVIPCASRSDNIGRDGGVHARPEDFAASRAPTFVPHRPPVRFREASLPSTP